MLGWAGLDGFGGYRGLRGDGMEHFIPFCPAQQLMKISPATSARAKPNGALRGPPGRRKINGAGALQLFCTSPADYNHQASSAPHPGAAGTALPWASLIETSPRSRKGLRPPVPSPCPFLPAPNQPPPLCSLPEMPGGGEIRVI